MAQETVRNDKGIVIGYIIDEPTRKTYRSQMGGVVGVYDKQLKQYFRYKQRPGKQMSSMYGDEGESDIRYWDGK